MHISIFVLEIWGWGNPSSYQHLYRFLVSLKENNSKPTEKIKIPTLTLFNIKFKPFIFKIWEIWQHNLIFPIACYPRR